MDFPGSYLDLHGYSRDIPCGSNICILLYLSRKEGFFVLFLFFTSGSSTLLQAVRHFTGLMYSMLWIHVKHCKIEKKTQTKTLSHTFDAHLEPLQCYIHYLFFLWVCTFFLIGTNRYSNNSWWTIYSCIVPFIYSTCFVPSLFPNPYVLLCSHITDMSTAWLTVTCWLGNSSMATVRIP